MRFDTRDKKPKLYHILLLSVLAAAVLGALKLPDGAEHMLTSFLVLDVYFLAVWILLLDAFFKQLQYNPYSYNTIFYIGFALFLLSVLATHVMITVQLLRFPEEYRVGEVFNWMTNSASTFMILSLPFILIFSAALCISNISLIRHEGRRFVNILGIILSVLLVGSVAFCAGSIIMPPAASGRS